MGLCEGCGQTILVIINILFSLIGIILLVIGCVVRFGSDLLDTYLQDAYSAFNKVLEEAAAGKDVSIENLNIGDLLADAALAFIVIGVFFFLLGIAGCIGACCKVKFLLIVYTIVLITIFVAEVVFVVLLFTIRSTIEDWFKSPLKSKLEDDYTGFNGTDSFTLAMNFIMHEMECCGVDNYTDFENAKKWKKNTNYTVPLICCKNSSDFTCGKQPNSNNSYISMGCYEAFDEWLTDNSEVLIGTGAGVAAVQFILIIFSIVICCASRKDDDDKSNYNDDNIPIQPYRESREASGHRNMYYEGSPKTYRSEVREQAPHQDSRSAPYRQGYDQREPYRGRTDYYNGPPEGYRSGPPPQDGRRGGRHNDGYNSTDGYQGYR